MGGWESQPAHTRGLDWINAQHIDLIYLMSCADMWHHPIYYCGSFFCLIPCIQPTENTETSKS